MTFQVLSSQPFGDFNRFMIKECRTRFGNTIFMVHDAERQDPYFPELPAIIAQEETLEAAKAKALAIA